MSSSTCTALIVAAGSGERFGGLVPKQYQDLCGQPILRRSILAFKNHPLITDVQVVISPGHIEHYTKATMGLDLPPPISGGKTRQESVRLGLQALAEQNPPDFVMIHDAARPLIDASTITSVHKALQNHKGAIAAKPLVDTLKKGSAGLIEATIDRENLWQAHTPQAFHFSQILQAHQDFQNGNFTDDAAIAEKAGFAVTLIPSNPDNMKITNPDDLGRAARLLGQNYGDIRTGIGFDVHRLIAGDKIWLGGIAIPHDRMLEGHSDADVVLHALVDALLGTISSGDIGTHFPPSDPQWKGKESGHFVRHTVRLLQEKGGLISNVDVMVMCEKPRIGPHRDAMIKNVAALLEIAPERVSIKATTTERLGFTGREEGIAAQAIATVRFPE